MKTSHFFLITSYAFILYHPLSYASGTKIYPRGTGATLRSYEIVSEGMELCKKRNGIAIVYEHSQNGCVGPALKCIGPGEELKGLDYLTNGKGNHPSSHIEATVYNYTAAGSNITFCGSRNTIAVGYDEDNARNIDDSWIGMLSQRPALPNESCAHKAKDKPVSTHFNELSWNPSQPEPAWIPPRPSLKDKCINILEKFTPDSVDGLLDKLKSHKECNR